ncbi:MAG: TetR/AcrR family transcriptional regulator [Parvularculaceae bacterium]
MQTKPNGKRQAILAAATELFLEEGYGAASINRLIERIGGSKSTVYAHFDSKEKLFEAVVESVIGELPTLIGKEQLESCDLREGLYAVSERLLEVVTSNRHLELARIVVAEADRFPEVGRIYYEHGPNHICEVLTAFVAARARAESLHIPQPRETVEAFTGMLLHHWIFRRFCVDPNPPSKAEVKKTAARAATLFLAALAGGGETRPQGGAA